MRDRPMAPKGDCPKCGNWYNGRYRSVWKGPKYCIHVRTQHYLDDYLLWECSICGYTKKTECLDKAPNS